MLNFYILLCELTGKNFKHFQLPFLLAKDWQICNKFSMSWQVPQTSTVCSLLKTATDVTIEVNTMKNFACENFGCSYTYITKNGLDCSTSLINTCRRIKVKEY